MENSQNLHVGGVINIYKEKGFTSHDVVAIVRKTLGRVKTGHTGTLDPDATGVLPICVGKSTKIADYIMTGNKTYIATLKLGIETDTLDTSGEILKETDVNIDENTIRNAILSFIGEQEQFPPMYSAVKINGKKLYELARAGKEVERKPRMITIFDIKDIVFLSKTEVSFEVTCSKGVYIRVLCQDIGRKLGVGGTMSALIRTKTSSFTIENSNTLTQFKEFVENNQLDKVLIPINKVLVYNSLIVQDIASKYYNNGNPISINYIINSDIIDLEEVNTAMFYLRDESNNLIGLYKLVNSEKTNMKTLLVPEIMLL